MRRLLMLFLLIPAIAFGQKSLDEIKRNVYSNPFSVANQNYIRMMEGRDGGNTSMELFFLEDWGKMVVKGVDEIKLEVDSANYVIPDDKIYFKNNGLLYKLFPGQVDKLVLGNSIFSCYHFDDGARDRKLGYFEVLVEGEFDLLKKYVIKNRKTNSNPMGIGNKTTEQYKDYKLYYFNPKEKIAIPVPAKKWQIIEVFGRKKSKMIEFARERDLSLKSDQDVQLLFSYYNLLMEVQKKNN